VSDETDARGRPAVVVEHPALAFALWLDRIHPARRPAAGVSRGAHVDPSARLGRGVSIAAGATVSAKARIGDRAVLSAGVFVGREAWIGEDSLLHPNAVVLDRCQVGARCVLHPGAVIGSDGFGFVWDGAAHRKIPQVGIVRVEDDVEIGANTTVDRATLGETVIGRGSKLDNLVQIGHNVVVGSQSIICGQAGIGGSARLGNRVTLAGQVGVSDHAEVRDGVTATGQAGILMGSRVPAGSVVSGMPAAPHHEFLKRSAWIARLPELARRLAKLEKSAAATSKGD
jgi:UDP-3-O-[3-hydroxymyristoyl] glucosamine N-acyltransferase